MGLKHINAYDKEDQNKLEQWENRKRHLRSLLVDTRTLTRDRLNDFRRGYIELDPVILFPKSEWQTLKFHEKQWLRVEAAARSSRGAILVGRSAARWYGMWVISTSKETVELTLPSLGNSPSRRTSGAYTFRRSELLDSELLFYDGRWATNPIRTFIDIARHHGFVEGLVAADYLLRRGISRMLIDEAVHAMGRCKGIATVRRCLKHAIPDSQSPYESYARALLIEAGIGPIRAQYRVDEFFADLCVAGWLLIEIDGDEKYRSNLDAVRLAEMKREKRIGNRGFKIMRYSPDFLLNHPERFIREVEEALAARDLLVERIG